MDDQGNIIDNADTYKKDNYFLDRQKSHDSSLFGLRERCTYQEETK